MQEDFVRPENDAEQFRRVWQRVQGAPGAEDFVVPDSGESRPLPPMPQRPPQSPERGETEAFLRAVMGEIAETACLCRRWQQLQGLARRCGGMQRKLAAALFLFCGVRHGPGNVRCPREGFSENCRTLYFRFRGLTAAFQRAAERTEEPELRGLFHELAGECRICKELVRQAVEGNFGV